MTRTFAPRGTPTPKDGEKDATSVVRPWYAPDVTMMPWLSRRIFRHAHGEVIGFRTRAGEHDMAKLGGERGKELLRVIEDGFLDVTGVGVQRLHLFVDSRYDTRVGVTDRGNVVVNVEILISVPVKQRDALAAYDFHGGVIEEPVTGSEALVPASDVLLHLIRELTEAVGIKAIDHGSGWLADVGKCSHGFSLKACQSGVRV